ADAPCAYRAIWKLVAARDQPLSFLRSRMRPVLAKNEARVRDLVADLDSDRFTVREKAARELEELEAAAESALRKALRGQPSVEVRRRIEELLRKLEGEESRRI